MEAKEVKRIASGRWLSIVSSLAPHFAKAVEKGKHCGCPIHGGTDGFRVFKDFDSTGGAVCNSCGIFNDGYSLLMWANGWDFITTHRAVSDLLGVDSSAKQHTPLPVKQQVKTSKNDEQDIRDSLNHVWTSGIPLAHKDAWPARKYLENRGIDGLDYSTLDSKVIRFVPFLDFFEGMKKVGVFPAIVTMMCDSNGRPATVHRTYITHDGKKAPVESPKKLMRHCGANLFGGMRLTQATGKVLAVTEGIENALAVMVKYNIPVWAAGNAHLLENFVPPQGVDVVIFADKDLPSRIHPEGHGQEAARSLLKRLWSEGIRASIKLPTGAPQGVKVDWLDVLGSKQNSVQQGKVRQAM